MCSHNVSLQKVSKEQVWLVNDEFTAQVILRCLSFFSKLNYFVIKTLKICLIIYIRCVIMLAVVKV